MIVKTEDYFKSAKDFKTYQKDLKAFQDRSSKNVVYLLSTEQERLEFAIFEAMSEIVRVTENAVSERLVTKMGIEQNEKYLDLSKLDQEEYNYYIKNCEKYDKAEGQYAVFNNLVSYQTTDYNIERDEPLFCTQMMSTKKYHNMQLNFGNLRHDSDEGLVHNIKIAKESIDVKLKNDDGKNEFSFFDYKDLYRRALFTKCSQEFYKEFSEEYNDTVADYLDEEDPTEANEVSQIINNSFCVVSMKMPDPYDMFFIIGNLKNFDLLEPYRQITGQQANPQKISQESDMQEEVLDPQIQYLEQQADMQQLYTQDQQESNAQGLDAQEDNKNDLNNLIDPYKTHMQQLYTQTSYPQA